MTLGRTLVAAAAGVGAVLIIGAAIGLGVLAVSRQNALTNCRLIQAARAESNRRAPEHRDEAAAVAELAGVLVTFTADARAARAASGDVTTARRYGRILARARRLELAARRVHFADLRVDSCRHIIKLIPSAGRVRPSARVATLRGQPFHH